MHSTLSQRQLLHGTPSTTSQRTLRARHDAQALAALLLVTLPSGPTELRFLGGDVVDVAAVPVVADVAAVATVDVAAAVAVVAVAGAAVAEFCSGAEGTEGEIGWAGATDVGEGASPLSDMVIFLISGPNYKRFS